MSIMLDIPPSIVQEARQYAESRGLSLNGLVRDYLTELTGRRGTARLMGAAARYADVSRRVDEKIAFRKAMEKRHAAVH